jgi:Glutamine cyclotransferase
MSGTMHRKKWYIIVFMSCFLISAALLGFYYFYRPSRKRLMQRLREVAVAPIYSVNVIKRFKQKKPVFVQGLDFQNHRLYTSSGLYGKSFIRVSNLQSGNVLRQIHMRKNLFAEGITIFHHKLYQLFWKSGRGFVYDYPSLKKISEFAVKGEGKGITHDKQY